MEHEISGLVGAKCLQRDPHCKPGYPFRSDCTQQGQKVGGVLPEGDYAKEAPWSGNSRDALSPFLPSNIDGFQFWRGNWNLFDTPRVPSPGLQARYVQTSGEADQRLGTSTASLRPGQASASLADCGSWDDSQSQVFVCDPDALRKTAHGYRFDQLGSLSIAAPGTVGAEAFPGLAMTQGAELRPGQIADISGHSGPQTQVQVSYLIGSTRYVGRLITDALASNRSATVSVGAKGATLASAGRVLPFAVTSATDLARPAPPSVVVRRRGRTGRGQVSVVSQTATVELVFVDRHGHRLGAVRRVAVRPGLRLNLAVRIPRQAAVLRVTSIDPVHGPSVPYGADVPPAPRFGRHATSPHGHRHVRTRGP